MPAGCVPDLQSLYQCGSGRGDVGGEQEHRTPVVECGQDGLCVQCRRSSPCETCCVCDTVFKGGAQLSVHTERVARAETPSSVAAPAFP